MTVSVSTACGHCGKPLHLEISYDPGVSPQARFQCRAVESDARPLVFSPLGVFGSLKDPSIIDAY